MFPAIQQSKNRKYRIGLLLIIIVTPVVLFIITNKPSDCSAMQPDGLLDNHQNLVSVLIIDKTGSMIGWGDDMGDTIWYDLQDCPSSFVNI